MKSSEVIGYTSGDVIKGLGLNPKNPNVPSEYVEDRLKNHIGKYNSSENMNFVFFIPDVKMYKKRGEFSISNFFFRKVSVD
jgi:hypothetical protein